MASTYSPLKFELIGTGDQDGAWGNTTNTNLGTAIEQAITGTGDVTFTGVDITLTLANTNNSQTARNLRLVLIGTSSGARQLIVPTIQKQYIIKNELADTVTVKTSLGTGVAVPSGKTMVVFTDGANVVDVTTYATSFATSGNLTVGGTLAAASPAFTGVPTAPTANVATNTTQIATTAFVLANGVPTATLMMWPLDTAPSGWLICDGTSVSTTTYAALYGVIGYTFGGSGGSFLLPDFRNRFPVGAGDSYVIGGTGGSKDAIVVSHTHTATSAVTDPGHNHTGLNGAPLTSYYPPLANGGGFSGSGRYEFPTTATSTTSITVGTTVNSAGSSGTGANLPPYLGIRFIIKT
jgi:microcystin-dependent protein